MFLAREAPAALTVIAGGGPIKGAVELLLYLLRDKAITHYCNIIEAPWLANG
eukprot:COSAG01_NODE_225_length_21277_cov_71.340023_6_plen_52_part_00